MTTNEDYKKGVCQCRKCYMIFHQSEIEHTYTEQLGQLSYNRVCPKCGSTDFGLIDYPVSEERLIYNNTNFPSELIRRLNMITEEILEEDRKYQEVIDELFI